MPQAVNIKGIDKPVYFPDGMKPEDIQRAIETDILPQLQATNEQATVDNPEPLSRLDSFKRGLTDVGEGIKQKFLQIDDSLNNRYNRKIRDNPTPAVTPRQDDVDRSTPYTEQVNEGRQNYVERRGPDAGFDTYRLGGNIAGIAPIALIPGGQGFAGRAGLGAIAGAASGAVQFDDTNSASGAAKNIGVGAATGAVAGPLVGFLGDKAGQAFRAIKGRLAGSAAKEAGKTSAQQLAKEIPEATLLPPDAQKTLFDEAIEQVRTTGSLNAEELRRKANLLANGLTPTKGSVTRNPRDWTIERNLQKMAQSTNPKLQEVGEQLTDVFRGNNQALTSQLQKFQRALPTGTQEQLGERAMRGVKSVADTEQKAVGELYNAVPGQDIVNLPPNKLIERLFSADVQDIEDAGVKTVVKTVENRLKRLGIVESAAKIGPDGSYNFELTGKGLTARQTEELRKLLNGLDLEKNAGRVRGQLIAALDDSIADAGGQDVYGAARQAASKRFSTLDNPAAQRAIDTLGEIQQGKTAQNFIQSQVVNAADQDVSALLKTLQSDPAGRDSLAAGLLKHLESKAINPNTGQFSGSNFNKAVEELGDAKLNLLLGNEGAAQVKSLARASVDATVEPPYSAVNHSNTGPLLLSATENIRKIPVVSALVTQELKDQVAGSAARKQLAESLSGRANAPQIRTSPRVQAMIDALTASAAPTAVAVSGQFKKTDKDKTKER